MQLLCATRWISALLLLFSPTASGAEPFFNVADYGAQADGLTPATAAFRAAIQAAKAAGGGTVFVPPGRYVTGPIELVSNMTLYVASGAVLQFPAQRLPFTEGREQSIECLTPVPLIGGRNLENVAIIGGGVLTTSNADWLNLMGRPEKNTAAGPGSVFGPAWTELLDALEKKTPAPRELYEKAAPHLRPSFIRTMDSKNITIDGLHIAGSPMWTIHLLYTERAVVNNVTIETYPGVHTDGIAVDSSRDVRISNSYIDTGDDGIVLKAGKDADGLRVNRPTENVTITNCNVHHAHGAVVLGSETSGWLRNIVADNITCHDTQIGVRIKSRRGRGGGVENVRFNNWTMDGVGVGINVTNYYVMEGEAKTEVDKVTNRTPVFRNIGISNMTIDHARTPIDVEGLPEMPIEALRISNVIASGRTGMIGFNTTALELHNVQVNAETGPAFLLRDSRSMELDGVATRKPSMNAPVIRLDRCPGTVIRASRAFEGTNIFLSVAPGEGRTVVMEGNALEGAKKPRDESAGDFWRTYQAAPDTN